MPTYYVTKYSLGGKNHEPMEVVGAPVDDPEYIKVDGHWTLFRLGRDVFTDIKEAHAAILKARDKKVASLKKQIAKLEAVSFP